MSKNWDKKFWIGVFTTFFLTGVGGVSAFYTIQGDNNDKILGSIAQVKRDSDAKYATKEETTFIREAMNELRDWMKTVDGRLYDIQKNQVLVKVANDRLVKISRRLSVANENVSDIKEEVQDQKILMQKAIGKNKK